MAASSVAEPLTAPFDVLTEEIPDRMIFYLDDCGKLASNWELAKGSMRTASKTALIGAAVGAIAGISFIVASRLIKPLKKPGKRFICKSATIAGFSGAFIGGALGATKAYRNYKRFKQIEIATAGLERKVANLCKAFFLAHFQSEELFCPISGQLFTIPVKIETCTCKPQKRYEFTTVIGWINDEQNPTKCGECENEFEPSDVKICEETFNALLDRVTEAFEKLGTIMKEEDTLFEPEEIPELGEATVERMRNGNTTALEGAIIRRYLNSTVDAYNEVMKTAQLNVYSKLGELEENGTITNEKYLTEVSRLHRWKKAVTWKIT